MPLFSWWTFSVPYFLNHLVLMLHHPQRWVPTWSHARQYPSVSFWHTEHRLSELHFPPSTESIQNQHCQSSHFKRGGDTYILALREWGNAGILWIMPQNPKILNPEYYNIQHLSTSETSSQFQQNKRPRVLTSSMSAVINSSIIYSGFQMPSKLTNK